MSPLTLQERLAELQPYIEEAEAILLALDLDYFVSEGFVECLNPSEPCLVITNL